ncbi:hypothetical protein BG004_007779 [Podila humilis]|nr:hypothetical protein BG004_007779 [Podila humilis]
MKLTFSTTPVVGSLLLAFSFLASPGTAATLDQCTVSLATLLSDPGLNQCLPIPTLAKLMTDPITPQLINNTATEFCSFPECKQPTLTLVQNTVAQNCIDNTTTDKSTSELVYGAAALYPPAKEGLCQRIPGGDGTFCITELTNTMTAYLAKHPSPLGIKIFANSTVLQQYVNEMPQALLCTPCNKAIISPLESYIAKNQATLNDQIKKWANVIKTEVARKCGSDFTDGVVPAPGGSGASNSSGNKNLAVAKVTSLGIVAVLASMML